MPASVVVFRSTANSRFDGSSSVTASAAARDPEQPDALAIIRTLARRDAIESQMVAGDIRGPSPASAPGSAPRATPWWRRSRSPQDRGPHAQAWSQRPSAADCASLRRISPIDTSNILTRIAISESAPTISQTPSPMPNGASHGPRCAKAKQRDRDDQRHRSRRRKALRRRQRIAPFPGEHRPERDHDQERHDQRREGEIEERRADRNLVLR